MGVKAIRERYRIEHIVQRVNAYEKYGGDVICIGSPYIHNIIVISTEGKIIRGREEKINISNDSLKRYIEEMEPDEKSGELKRLFHFEDIIGPTVPCYTSDKGRVIRKRCEALGWPNTTTDGEIMYKNTYFETHGQALAILRQNTKIDVKLATESFGEAFSELKRKACRLLRHVWYYTRARVMP